MDALIIGGHFSVGRGDSLRHNDDFRLTVDGVPMTAHNLMAYFDNGRHLADPERRRVIEDRRPYRHVYWSGLHLMNLLLRHGYEAALIHCHDITDRHRLSHYRQNPKCVIISTTFMNIDAVREVVQDVREHLPDAFIVVGGAYSRYSQLVLEKQEEPDYACDVVRNRYFFTMDEPLEEIDLYVTDQHGENTLLKIMTLAQNGERPTDLPNTIARVGGKGHRRWERNPGLPETYDINEHRIRWRDIPRSCLGTVVPFQNTYGCPFKCSFCNFSLTKVHKKSIDGLIEELCELAEQNIAHTVWFTDDNFFLNEKLVQQFCEAYIAAGKPFAWKTFVRASSITPLTAPLLKEARCSLLILGLESGSQTVLDNIEKHDTVEHYADAVKLLVENGIDLELSFIFGLPGENERTVQETLDFINAVPQNDLQASYLYLFKFNVLPLSPVFTPAHRERFGVEGYFDKWRHNTMASNEVDDVLRHVAASAQSTVFNYIDADVSVPKPKMMRLMREREELGRFILRNGREAAGAAPLWDRLEETIRRDFLKSEGAQAAE